MGHSPLSRGTDTNTNRSPNTGATTMTTMTIPTVQDILIFLHTNGTASLEDITSEFPTVTNIEPTLENLTEEGAINARGGGYSLPDLDAEADLDVFLDNSEKRGVDLTDPLGEPIPETKTSKTKPETKTTKKKANTKKGAKVTKQTKKASSKAKASKTTKKKATKAKGKTKAEETPQDANVENTTEETSEEPKPKKKGGRRRLTDEEKAEREAAKQAEKERKAKERAEKKAAKEKAKAEEKARKAKEREEKKKAKEAEKAAKAKAKQEEKERKAREKAEKAKQPPASKVRASWSIEDDLSEGATFDLHKTINGRSTVTVGADITSGTEVKACWDCGVLYPKFGGMFRPRFSEAFLDALTDADERASKAKVVQPRCVACDRARSRRKSGLGAIRKFVLQFSTLDADEVVIHPDRKNYQMATDGEFSTLMVKDEEMEPKLRGDIVSLAYERDIKIVFTTEQTPEMTGVTKKMAKAVCRSADTIKPVEKPKKEKKAKAPKTPKATKAKGKGGKPKVRDLAAEKAAREAKKAEEEASAKANPKLQAMFEEAADEQW